MRALIIGLLLTVACGGDDDTDPAVDTADTGGELQGCDATFLFVDGREQPQVGDDWTVIMKCEDDGATLVGPMVLRITPPSLATIQNNTLTFVEDGEGQLRVQVGTYVERKDVTVLP